MSVAAKLIREARVRAGLTQSELARRAGTSQPTVAAYEAGTKTPTVATLDRLLEAAGAEVRAEPRGPARPRRLRRLVDRHRSDILEAARRHGARNVRVFGSVARGAEGRTSDIDLLVDMEAGRSLLDLVRLRRELRRLLGVEVDVVSSGGLLPRDRRLLRSAEPL